MHSAFVSYIKPKNSVVCTFFFFCSRTDSSSPFIRISLIANGRSIMLIALRLHLNFPWDSRLDKAIMNPMWLWDYGLFQCALLSNGGFRINIRINLVKSEVDICRRLGKLENAFCICRTSSVLHPEAVVVNLDIFLSPLKTKQTFVVLRTRSSTEMRRSVAQLKRQKPKIISPSANLCLDRHFGIKCGGNIRIIMSSDQHRPFSCYKLPSLKRFS